MTLGEFRKLTAELPAHLRIEVGGHILRAIKQVVVTRIGSLQLDNGEFPVADGGWISDGELLYGEPFECATAQEAVEHYNSIA